MLRRLREYFLRASGRIEPEPMPFTPEEFAALILSADPEDRKRLVATLASHLSQSPKSS